MRLTLLHRLPLVWSGVARLILLGLLFSLPGLAFGRPLLHGSRPAVVGQLRALRDLAATNRLALAIGLPLRNTVALTNLLAELYNPASPNYRHFLSVAEFTDQFGPTAADYQAVIAFAQAHGFTVTGTQRNRMVLEVSATVADIETTLRTRLRMYAHPREHRDFFAPDTEPQLDLAVPVLDIEGLDDYVLPQAMNHEWHPPAAQTNAPAGAPQPAGTGSGPSGTFVGGDFRAAYAPSVSLDGTGQSVALVEFNAGYFASDIQAYETAYHVPNVPLVNVLLNGISNITNNGATAEPPLDIEMAISMATNLNSVIIYDGTSSSTIMSRIASDNIAKQIGTSWTFGASSTTLQAFQQMAAQGQSYFNASGDSDAYPGSPSTPTDVPYVTCVGGTTLTTTGPGGAWSSEKVWNWGGGTGSSGGTSTTYAIPPYQQGLSMTTNLGSAAMRNIPDVAMTADNIRVLYKNGGAGSFGGTSCATPLWAAFTALVNQQAAALGRPPIGFINPTVYALGQGANYGLSFNDITTGNNTSSKSPGQYYAVPGYDLCTGWGTPRGLGLIFLMTAAPFDPLVVTPAGGGFAAGPAGGPFSPASPVYAVVNYGGSTNKWSLLNTSVWFNASPASGSLASGASANVTVTVAPAANSLAPGMYSATLQFSNASTQVVQSRPLTLAVGAGLTWNGGGGTTGALDGGGSWSDATLGTDTNWWDGANVVTWNGAAPDLATFGAGSGAADVVTLNSPVSAVGLNFNPAGSGNYTLAGTNLLTLGGTLNATVSATISAPLALGFPAIFTVASGQTLTISSVIGGATGNNLVLNGPGSFNLTGQNNASQSAGMAGTVTINSGSVTVNSGNCQFGTLGNVAGLTVASGATLTLAGFNALSGYGGTARNVTLNGGTLTAPTGNHALGVLTLNGGTVSSAGTVPFGSFNLMGDCLVTTNATLSAQNVTQGSGSHFGINNGKTLTFSGTLTGSGGLNLVGPGTLLLTGSNTYSGATVISGGTLQVGNAGTTGTLGSGAVTDNDTLVFNHSDAIAISNVISGVGLVSQNGAGITTLAKANSHSGGTTVKAGRLRAGNNTAPGTGLVTLTGGALSSDGTTARTFANALALSSNVTLGDLLDNGRLTFNGAVNLGGAALTLTNASDAVFAGGCTNGRIAVKQGAGTLTLQGLVVWTGASDIYAGTVILNGTTFTNSDRIRPAAVGATTVAHLIITNGAKVFLNATGNGLIAGGTVTPAGTNILDLAGFCSTPNANTSNGNVLLQNATSLYSEINFLPGGDYTARAVATTGSGSNPTRFNFNGGILRALTNNASFFQGLTAAYVRSGGANLDDGGFAITIAQNLLDGGGGGGLNKIGAGTLTLAGVNTYTGATTVSNGTLQVSGSLAGGVAVRNGATLAGTGSVAGPVTVAGGGTLTPALNVIGSMTISNSLTVAGTLRLGLDKPGGTPVNDQVLGLTSLNLAGAAVLITNLSGATLAAGDQFNFFNGLAASGVPASVALPSLNTGLRWITNLTVDGSVRVAFITPTTPTNLGYSLTSGTLTLNWPSNYLGWSLQVQTNPPGVGLSTNWVTVPGSSLVTSTNFPVSPGNGAVFYRMFYQP